MYYLLLFIHLYAYILYIKVRVYSELAYNMFIEMLK